MAAILGEERKDSEVTVYCPNCGTVVAAGSSYCTVCGTNLTRENPAPASSTPASSTGFRPAPPLDQLASDRTPSYAPWIRRVLGAIVDGICVGVPSTVLAVYVLFIRGTVHVGTRTATFRTGRCTYAHDTLTCPGGTYIHANFRALVLGVVLINLAWAVYVILAIAGPRRATIGMRALRIQIVLAADGSSRVTRARSLLRYAILVAIGLLYYLNPLLGLVVLLNYLWPLWDRHNQTFHDKAAGTVALDTRGR